MTNNVSAQPRIVTKIRVNGLAAAGKHPVTARLKNPPPLNRTFPSRPPGTLAIELSAELRAALVHLRSLRPHCSAPNRGRWKSCWSWPDQKLSPEWPRQPGFWRSHAPLDEVATIRPRPGHR